MEKKIIITYRWWTDDKDEVPTEHQSQLEEHAEERINEMRSEDYTSGELIESIYDDGKYFDYHGHWEVTTETL